MADLIVEKVTHDGGQGPYLAHGYDADTREPDLEPVWEDDEARRLITALQSPEFVDGFKGTRVPVLPRLARREETRR